jgi:hypothetical protein
MHAQDGAIRIERRIIIEVFMQTGGLFNIGLLTEGWSNDIQAKQVTIW